MSICLAISQYTYSCRCKANNRFRDLPRENFWEKSAEGRSDESLVRTPKLFGSPFRVADRVRATQVPTTSTESQRPRKLHLSNRKNKTHVMYIRPALSFLYPLPSLLFSSLVALKTLIVPTVSVIVTVVLSNCTFFLLWFNVCVSLLDTY